MSEQAPETVSQPSTEATQGDPADALGDAGKKALAAEREARKAAEKTAAEFAAKFKEIEQASLSDLEKAQTAARDNEALAAKATAEALRWRIAAKHKIGDEDAETFLTGGDEETLTRQAERLAALATSTGPRADPSQGAQGEPVSAPVAPGVPRLAQAFEQELSK